MKPNRRVIKSVLIGMVPLVVLSGVVLLSIYSPLFRWLAVVGFGILLLFVIALITGGIIEMENGGPE